MADDDDDDVLLNEIERKSCFFHEKDLKDIKKQKAYSSCFWDE